MIVTLRHAGAELAGTTGRETPTGVSGGAEAVLYQKVTWNRPAPYYIEATAGGAAMTAKPKIALTAAVIFGIASAALAKDSGPPNVDIQRICRDSSSALIGLTDDPKQDLNSCISDEQAARDELTKDWANYPAVAKSACIKPNEYLPGYVEWQSCLEMTRDVIKMRQDQTASAGADSHASGQSSGRRTGSKSRECPVVHTADDGSIDWVINC
jgi:hypothetical protein